MSAEFKVHDEKGEIDFGIMAPGQASALRAIIDNWPKYYVTQWRIKINAERKKAEDLNAANAALQKRQKECDAKVKALRDEIARLKCGLATKRREQELCRRAQCEVASLKSSEAYRVGMFVTWPARKAWSGVKCLRCNGFAYTIKHLFGKVARCLGLRNVKW